MQDDVATGCMLEGVVWAVEDVEDVEDEEDVGMTKVGAVEVDETKDAVHANSECMA
jgi:hypothetical protein